MAVFILHDNMSVPDDIRNDDDWEEFENQLLGKTLDMLAVKSDSNPGLFLFPQMLSGNGNLNEGQRILFKRGDGNGVGSAQLWTGNVMGFIGYDNNDLYIMSRFGGTQPGVYTTDESSNKYSDGGMGDNDNMDNCDAAGIESGRIHYQSIHDYFLNYMLGKVLGFNSLNITEWMTHASLEEQAQRLYTLMFPALLRQSWNQGVYRRYVRRSFNDAYLRGGVDIARHLRANVPFTGKIAYNTREFSADNFVNQLVRHTIEYLLESGAYGRLLLQGVRDIIKQIRFLTPGYRRNERMTVLQRNLQTPVRHGFYWSYRQLQRLCICILQHKGLSYVGDRRIHGILFDGAWLWEEYLNTIIGDEYFHPRNTIKQGRQYLFENEKSLKEGLIYPDFISRNRTNRTAGRIIVDAKYKTERNIGKGNGDYFQMLSYMFRFESRNGYFVYPITDGGTNVDEPIDRGLSLLSGVHIPMQGTRVGEQSRPSSERAGGSVTVHKMGLRIPTVTNCVSYEDFCNRMRRREDMLRRALGIQ